MNAFIHRFERLIVQILVLLMMVCVMAATVELAVVLVRGLIAPPYALLDLKNLLDVLGFFMLVLVALELLETIKAYLREDVFHVEIVILAAIVALARKVIVMDSKEVPVETYYGLGATLLALGGCYWLVKWANREGREKAEHGPAES